MRSRAFALATILVLSAAGPGRALPESIESLGCGDLKMNVDRDLSVVCEVSNETSIPAGVLRARVEYMAAEELGPIASHIIDAIPYDPEGIPPRSRAPVSFAHPEIPSAYLEFLDPIIRVEILEALDPDGRVIYRRETSARPAIILPDQG